MNSTRYTGLAIVAMLAAVLAGCNSAPRQPEYPAAVISADGYEVQLSRAPNGHFYTTAMVNGQPIRFVVDTGATTVALSKQDAQAAGIAFSDESFTETGLQAGGEIRVMPVTLQSVDIGNIEVAQVDAVVLDGEGTQSLLGQNWLRRLNSVQIEKDMMTLR